MYLGSSVKALKEMFAKAGCRGRIAIHLQERIAENSNSQSGQEKCPQTQRKADFEAGRAMASRCVETLGGPDRPIGRGAHREPIWPEGLTGSISHTNGFVIAVACETSAAATLGVGIDVERSAGVQEELYETVFTDNERLFLEGVDAAERSLVATYFFSAKEALFKAQFPLTRRFVDFTEVDILIDSEIAQAGTLRFKHGIAALEPYRIALFYRLVGDFVVTGAVVTLKI